MKTALYVHSMASAGKVNFSGQWSTAWGKITGNITGFLVILGIVGVLMVVVGIGKYVWDKRRGGANPSNLAWTVGIGMILCAPSVVIPLLLKILDQVVNAVLSIIS